MLKPWWLRPKRKPLTEVRPNGDMVFHVLEYLQTPQGQKQLDELKAFWKEYKKGNIKIYD